MPLTCVPLICAWRSPRACKHLISPLVFCSYGYAHHNLLKNILHLPSFMAGRKTGGGGWATGSARHTACCRTHSRLCSTSPKQSLAFNSDRLTLHFAAAGGMPPTGTLTMTRFEKRAGAYYHSCRLARLWQFFFCSGFIDGSMDGRTYYARVGQTTDGCVYSH